MHRTFSHSRQAARSFQGKHPTAPYCQIEPGEIIFKDIIKYFLKQLLRYLYSFRYRISKVHFTS